VSVEGSTATQKGSLPTGTVVVTTDALADNSCATTPLPGWVPGDENDRVDALTPLTGKATRPTISDAPTSNASVIPMVANPLVNLRTALTTLVTAPASTLSRRSRRSQGHWSLYGGGTMAAGLHWIVCPRTEVVVSRAARFCRPMGIPQFSKSKGAGAQGGGGHGLAEAAG
jgi:hypothetical protein